MSGTDLPPALKHYAYPGDVLETLLQRMEGHSLWQNVRQLETANPILARDHAARMALLAPVPTAEHLRLVMDVALFGSLHEEEGRRITPTLAYAAPKAALKSSQFEPYVFASPLPFDAERVAKLAPAARSDRTYLGVYPNAQGVLEIWGLMHRGNRVFGIDLEIPPEFLRVHVMRPGTLSVHYGGQLMLLYSRGRATLFDQGWDLASKLRDGLAMEAAGAQAICRIARRMVEHGHGGTLLVVSEPSARGVAFHPSYRHDPANEILKQALEEYRVAREGGGLPSGSDLGKTLRMGRNAEQSYEDALAFVSRLTAVDGATVIGIDLSLIGFGATIPMVEQLHDIVVDLEDPRTRDVKERKVTEFSGHRHKSAIVFCNSQVKPALALVASQDGDVSVFARLKERDRVVGMRPFELGIGI